MTSLYLRSGIVAQKLRCEVVGTGGESSASLPEPDRTCVTGNAFGKVCSTQACYSSYWGAGIGINLNQATGTGTTPMNYTPANSSGVSYSLDALPGTVRLVAGDSQTDYCVTLTSSSGLIPWGAFSNTCWNSTGTHLGGPPPSFTSLRFQVIADDTYGYNTQFNFCITQLSL